MTSNPIRIVFTLFRDISTFSPIIPPLLSRNNGPQLLNVCRTLFDLGWYKTMRCLQFVYGDGLLCHINATCAQYSVTMLV